MPRQVSRMASSPEMRDRTAYWLAETLEYSNLSKEGPLAPLPSSSQPATQRSSPRSPAQPYALTTETLQLHQSLEDDRKESSPVAQRSRKRSATIPRARENPYPEDLECDRRLPSRYQNLPPPPSRRREDVAQIITSSQRSRTAQPYLQADAEKALGGWEASSSLLSGGSSNSKAPRKYEVSVLDLTAICNGAEFTL